MMNLGLLFTLAIAQQTAPMIDYRAGAFTVSAEGFSQTVQAVDDPARPTRAMSVRSGEYWVMWDDRGLTVRVGDQATTTRLGDVATSPRVQTRDEIIATAEKIASGRRSRDAKALSGWQFSGDELYLVFRWEESDGTPWLEALFRLNVPAKDRKPALVGRFEGLSQAKGAVDERLFLHRGAPAMVTTREHEWGISAWDASAGKATFSKLGERLMSNRVSADGESVFFLERSAYGTALAGRTATDGVRELFAEFRGQGYFVSTEPAIVLIEDDRNVRLRICESGQEQSFALGTAATMTERGILAWSPKDAPVRAVLLSATDLSPLARWSLE